MDSIQPSGCRIGKLDLLMIFRYTEFMLRKMRKFLFGFFALLAILIIGIAFFIGYKAEKYKKSFEQSSGANAGELISRVQQGWDQTPQTTNGWKHVLLLGADEVAGRPEGVNASNVLTDSVIIISLHLQSGKIVQYALPRDLWIDVYKTKINALYHYGFLRTPEEPTLFVKQVIQEITGVSVHNVVVLKLSTVAEIIDVLGGLDIEVKRTFEDKLFPKSGVDVATVRDPKLLYETVQFIQGTEHMFGERALVYLRSRHSTDEIEGTDEGRIARQKQVIQALLSALLKKEFVADPTKLGKLYAIYSRNFGSSVSVEDGSATIRTLLESMSMRNQSNILFSQKTLSIQGNGNKGVLYHPINLRAYGGQWVYIPVKGDFSAMQNEIQGFYEEK